MVRFHFLLSIAIVFITTHSVNAFIEVAGTATPNKVEQIAQSNVSISTGSLLDGDKLSLLRPAPELVWELTQFKGFMKINGDYLYLVGDQNGSGNMKLVIYDVTDPASPSELSRLDIEYKGKMFFSEDRLYLASYSYPGTTLAIVDVADKSNPHFLSQTTISDLSWCGEICLVGNTAFLLTEKGFRTYDVSDPSHPVFMANHDFTADVYWSGFWSMAAAGNSIYLAGREPSLVVVDVSTPSTPEVKGTLTIGSFGTDALALSGNYAYLGLGWEGIAVVDISDPTWPHVVNMLTDSSYSLAATGDTLFSYDYSPKTVVYSLSDPENPQITSTVGIASETEYSMAAEGAYLYVYGEVTTAEGTASKLGIFHVHPNNPTLIEGSVSLLYDANAGVEHLIAGPSSAYASETQFFVIDLAAPSSPVVSGFCNVNGATKWMHIDETYKKAYLIRSRISAPLQSYLTTIDFSDPSKPVWAGNVAWDYTAGNVLHSVVGTTLYAFSGTRGLLIYSLADPNAVVQLAQYDSTTHEELPADFDVSMGAVQEGYAYMIHTGAGAEMLEVADVTDPAAPLHVASVDLSAFGGEFFSGLLTGGDNLYITTRAGSLIVVDISTPASASIRRTIYLETLAQLNDLSLLGNILYGISVDQIVGYNVSDLNNVFIEELYSLAGVTSFSASAGFSLAAMREDKRLYSLPLDKHLAAQSIDGATAATVTVDAGMPAGAYDLLITSEDGTQRIAKDILEVVPQHMLSFRRPPSIENNPVWSLEANHVTASAQDSLAWPIYYSWSASCPGLGDPGIISDPTSPTTVWTSPQNLTDTDQLCTLSVNADNGSANGSLSAGANLFVTVAKHEIVFSELPYSTKSWMLPFETTQVGADVADTAGLEVFTTWSASCAGLDDSGTFGDPTLMTTTWTAPVNNTGNDAVCTLTFLAENGAVPGALSVSKTVDVTVEPHILRITNAGYSFTITTLSETYFIIHADDNMGLDIFYSWSASCEGLEESGTFLDPASSNTSWAAPLNNTGSDVTCTLTITAHNGSEPGALSVTDSITATVRSHTISLTPPQFEGGTTVDLYEREIRAIATDNLRWELFYHWSARCENFEGSGTFRDTPGNGYIAWTPPWNYEGSDLSCTVTVTVDNGDRTGSLSTSVDVAVLVPGYRITFDTLPHVEGNYENGIPPNNSIRLATEASDNARSSLVYGWSSHCDGLSDSGSFPDYIGSYPNEVRWISAYNDTTQDAQCTITVTAHNRIDPEESASSVTLDVTVLKHMIQFLRPPTVEKPRLDPLAETFVAFYPEDNLGLDLFFDWSITCEGLPQTGELM